MAELHSNCKCNRSEVTETQALLQTANNNKRNNEIQNEN